MSVSTAANTHSIAIMKTASAKMRDISTSIGLENKNVCSEKDNLVTSTNKVSTTCNLVSENVIVPQQSVSVPSASDNLRYITTMLDDVLNLDGMRGT